MGKKRRVKRFDEGGVLDSALSKYDKVSEEHPLAKLAFDLIPVTGVATSAADTVSDLKKRQYGKAAVDSLGLIPGVKTITTAAKGVNKATSSVKNAGPVWETLRNIDRGADITEAQAKQERNTKEKNKKQNVAQSMGKKKGGAVRGHGCEQRGKTKGRFV